MKRANIINAEQIELLLAQAARTKNPTQWMAVTALTIFAGCRIGEAAQLKLEDLLNAAGEIDTYVHIDGSVAKYGRSRSVSMHPRLVQLLKEHIEKLGMRSGPLFWDQYGKPLTPGAAQKTVSEFYKKAGFRGCSSHSGRRTFITHCARSIGRHGLSLRDVQQLAGHAHLNSTECYIEASGSLGDLVSNLYNGGSIAIERSTPAEGFGARSSNFMPRAEASRVLPERRRKGQIENWSERSEAAWTEWNELTKARRSVVQKGGTPLRRLVRHAKMILDAIRNED
jgi:hypothetical protein